MSTFTLTDTCAKWWARGLEDWSDGEQDYRCDDGLENWRAEGPKDSRAGDPESWRASVMMGRRTRGLKGQRTGELKDIVAYKPSSDRMWDEDNL